MTTTVCAKPNNPGKPDSPGKPVETWDLQIWIGLRDSQGNPLEDIVLMAPEFLFAEDVPCSGGLWNLPKKKGKGMNSYLGAAVDLTDYYGDDCGTYQLAHVEGENSEGETTFLDDFNLESYETVWVSIQHQINPSGEDYWSFWIQWIIDFETYEGYQFMAWTDKNPDPEGTLSETEGWLVEFVGAEAMVYYLWDWADENPLDGVPDVYDWVGTVSFTVRITRSPAVA